MDSVLHSPFLSKRQYSFQEVGDSVATIIGENLDLCNDLREAAEFNREVADSVRLAHRDIAILMKENQSMMEEITDSKSVIGAAVDKIKELQAQLSVSQREKEDMQREYRDSQTLTNKLQSKLQGLIEEKLKLEEEVVQLRDIDRSLLSLRGLIDQHIADLKDHCSEFSSRFSHLTLFNLPLDLSEYRLESQKKDINCLGSHNGWDEQFNDLSRALGATFAHYRNLCVEVHRLSSVEIKLLQVNERYADLSQKFGAQTAELSKLQEALNSASAQIERLRIQCDTSIQQKTAEEQRCKELESNLQKVGEALAASKQQLTDKTDECQTLSDKNSALGLQLKQSETSFNDLEQKHGILHKNLRCLQKKLHAAETEKRQLLFQHKQLSSEQQRENQTLNDTLLDLQRRYKAKEDECTTLQDQLTRIEEANKELLYNFASERKKCEALVFSNTDLKANNKELEAELRVFKVEYERLQISQRTLYEKLKRTDDQLAELQEFKITILKDPGVKYGLLLREAKRMYDKFASQATTAPRQYLSSPVTEQGLDIENESAYNVDPVRRYSGLYEQLNSQAAAYGIGLGDGSSSSDEDMEQPPVVDDNYFDKVLRDSGYDEEVSHSSSSFFLNGRRVSKDWPAVPSDSTRAKPRASKKSGNDRLFPRRFGPFDSVNHYPLRTGHSSETRVTASGARRTVISMNDQERARKSAIA